MGWTAAERVQPCVHPTSTTSVSGILRSKVLVRLLVSDAIDFTFRDP